MAAQGMQQAVPMTSDAYGPAGTHKCSKLLTPAAALMATASVIR